MVDSLIGCEENDGYKIKNKRKKERGKALNYRPIYHTRTYSRHSGVRTHHHRRKERRRKGQGVKRGMKKRNEAQRAEPQTRRSGGDESVIRLLGTKAENELVIRRDRMVQGGWVRVPVPVSFFYFPFYSSSFVRALIARVGVGDSIFCHFIPFFFFTLITRLSL